MQMAYEVERKYRIKDLVFLIERLAEVGGEFAPPVVQVDTYYSHPGRDFARTDEALRIRRVENDAFITYKGPKVDDSSKTRQEIELPLMNGVKGALGHARLLEALGFRAIASVSKKRRKADLTWQGHEVEVSLDEVDSIGTFVELESAADEAGLTAALKCLASLAEKLGLTHDERRSYLELLLAPPDGGAL